MQEIKFRYIWKKISDGKLWFEIVPIECIEGKGDKPFVLVKNNFWELFSRDLYTGLRDSEDKEIYEGDFVSKTQKDSSNDYGRKRQYIAPVEWKYSMWYVGFGNFYNWSLGQLNKESSNEIKTIGNKHENPELLER